MKKPGTWPGEIDVQSVSSYALQMLSRRGLITGLGALIAAPAIVRAETLMKIRGLPMGRPLAIAAEDVLLNDVYVVSAVCNGSAYFISGPQTISWISAHSLSVGDRIIWKRPLSA